MNFSKLPLHALGMDEPTPSEVIRGSNGEVNYRWVLTNTERAHINAMLDANGELQTSLPLHYPIN